MEKLEGLLNTFKIKEHIFHQQELKIKEFQHEKLQMNEEKQGIIRKANSQLSQLEEIIDQLKMDMDRKDQKIEQLQKEMKDNEHLLTEDQYNYKQHLGEIDNLKLQLSEVTQELENYKAISESNPMGNRMDVDKELQKQQQIFTNKLQSTHQQIDSWKHKFRDADKKCSSYQKQIYILQRNLSAHGNNSTAVADQSEINEVINRIREIFGISMEDDVFSELERVKEELETLELLKEENEKANELYNSLKEKHEKLVNNMNFQGGNEYTEELIRDKTREIDHLNNEIRVLCVKIEEAENNCWEFKHENNVLKGDITNIERIARDRENEINKLRNINSELKSSLENDDARKYLIEKKELEAKLEEIGKQSEFEKSKTGKDFDYLKKNSHQLISFIMSLEFAYDEEFDKLFKNQSHSNEFEQAKKHLEYQKDIVASKFDRLQSE